MFIGRFPSHHLGALINLILHQKIMGVWEYGLGLKFPSQLT